MSDRMSEQDHRDYLLESMRIWVRKHTSEADRVEELTQLVMFLVDPGRFGGYAVSRDYMRTVVAMLDAWAKDKPQMREGPGR